MRLKIRELESYGAVLEVHVQQAHLLVPIRRVTNHEHLARVRQEAD
jgi:hypothetical protein